MIDRLKAGEAYSGLITRILESRISPRGENLQQVPVLHHMSQLLLMLFSRPFQGWACSITVENVLIDKEVIMAHLRRHSEGEGGFESSSQNWISMQGGKIRTPNCNSATRIDVHNLNMRALGR